VSRVLDGIDAFLDGLASVDVRPALLAVLVHVGRLACTSMAWRNVLAAAYSEERVPRLSIFGAYLAGVGINAIIPVRAGDVVRVVLAHRAIPKSTYTTIVSSTFVLSLFDMAAASLLLVWAATTQDAFPGIGSLPDLPSFEFAWLLDHPLTADLVLAALFIVLVGLGFWLQDHVVNFWARVRQPFVVFRPASRYFRGVAAWQAGDWALRLVTIWYMLDAFDIPQTLGNVLLVQVSVSVATLVPLTPAGIGSEQAFLLYVFRGTVESSKLLAFSVGMKLTIVASNVVMGFAAIALTLRTVRYSRAVGPLDKRPS
jgi:uncharacterized membrane protein YbhN (UPF0104 family)